MEQSLGSEVDGAPKVVNAGAVGGQEASEL